MLTRQKQLFRGDGSLLKKAGRDYVLATYLKMMTRCDDEKQGYTR
jgi:hypothetical protein